MVVVERDYPPVGAGGRKEPAMADPVSVLKDYDAAWNAHDIEGVMAFFTDDARVRMEPPLLPMNSAEFIVAKSRYALGSSSRLWRVSMSSPATIK